ncbi:hypothetical protein C2869_04090 [Saccharobesus litoralis]|uniref:Uncharacterized protein n=1 Tax=Saccharobesus litoralis TaxID=2172099 RepID=A0A2S0VN89_9ALTE|nr:hypothetical protein [Saccharobesus litoralis]AWB65666.1 hypothetical protein C2869_04090 [Saccharobesus litoralis]
MPISQVSLQVDQQMFKQAVNKQDKSVVFEVEVKAGTSEIKGLMLDKNQQVLAGTYYEYVTKIR